MWRLAGAPVDHDRPGDFNQSMMEFGATVCTPKSPECGACPVRRDCAGYRERDSRDSAEDIEDCHLCLSQEQYQPQLGVTNYPRKGKKAAAREQETLVLLVSAGQGESLSFLMERRPSKGLLAGLLQFPCLELPAGQETKQSDKLKLLREKMSELNVSSPSPRLVDSLVHVFSHIKMTYTVYTCHSDDDQGLQGLLMSEEEFESCGTSTAMRKVFKCYKATNGGEKNIQKKKKKVEKQTDKKQPNIKSFFQVKS